jgi:hypothetical protein
MCVTSIYHQAEKAGVAKDGECGGERKKKQKAHELTSFTSRSNRREKNIFGVIKLSLKNVNQRMKFLFFHLENGIFIIFFMPQK